MQVSVILAVYNEENWIRVALDSLKEQTIPFQLIVVDNGSDDNTVEIAEEYTDNVFCIQGGKLEARNYGVEESSGEVVVFTDADCLYSVDFLERITEPFSDPSVVLVSGQFYNVTSPSFEKVFFWVRNSLVNFFLYYSPGAATAYRRSAFLKAGGYRTTMDAKKFLSVAWEELYRFNREISRYGRRVWRPQANCYHQRDRRLCTVTKVDGESPFTLFCKEIETGTRF